MPKHEIKHIAGEHISKKLKNFLLDFFKEADIGKLERLGGRVLISIAAPYSPKESKEKRKVIITDALITSLHNLRDKPEELKAQIGDFSVSQLRKLGKLAGQPLRTKSPRQELISELTTFFRSDEIWRRISQDNIATAAQQKNQPDRE
jgi:hypothetical protein